MSINLKKEQVLALVVLFFCAWQFRGMDLGDGTPARFSPSQAELAVEPVGHVPLIETAAPVGGRQNLFTEPRETQPLPPRSLAFPPQEPRTLVALPLTMGPDYRHLVLAAIDGSLVPDVTITAPVTAEVTEAAEPTVDEPQSYADKIRQAQSSYDSVYLVEQKTPYVGVVEVSGIDKFDAEEMSDFSQHSVRLRKFNVKTGKFDGVITWKPEDLAKVARIQLANTLPNQIERERRKVRDGQPGTRQRFVEWLLEQARENVWVYETALQQAGTLAQEIGGGIDGLRWQLRVIRAKGDLAQEFELLAGIQGPNRESSLRYEGLGRIQAKLGLWQDAERDLRRAVGLGPLEASPHVAFAEFLLMRGRTREAVLSAKAAERAIGTLTEGSDQARAWSVIVSCYLAAGDVAAARSARSSATGEATSPMLDGAIAYADGDVQAALASFRNVTSAPGVGGSVRGEARLGEAACQLRLGQWQEAHDILLDIYDEHPLLRHAASAGLALLFQKIGQFEPSLTWVDRALEADPTYAYAHYLRGRTLRLSAQYEHAEEALKEALRLHDDFVHAIAELTTVYTDQAQGEFGEQRAVLLDHARRYADRAVDLSPIPLSELHEVQGIRHFAVGDRRSATAAFESSLRAAQTDAAAQFARGALSVVDYSRGRVDDARDALRAMSDDLAKEDPIRAWAMATIDDIDEHGQKELLEDRFERNKPGNIWNLERDGMLVAEVEDGQLVFEGTFKSTGEVSAQRAGAVQQGRNFLAVGVTMKVGAGHTRDGFCGLRISTQQGNRGGTACRIEVGVNDGEPMLVVVDNREEPKKPAIEVANFDLAGEQELELRVLPTGQSRSQTFRLQVSWNGQIVYEQGLETLRGGTQSELKTVLFVQGRRGAPVDVVFDAYRLERRKER